MSKSVKSLQKVYDLYCSQWEAHLTNLVDSVSIQLQEYSLKFSVKSRVKKIESFNVKQTRLKVKKSRPRKKITDLLGLRVIVPFQEDVEHVISIIQNNYKIIEFERKSEQLSYREFAYDSVHLLIALDGDPLVLPKHCLPCCEIQIRTILQDAWAEVEHELIYKSNVRFYNESTQKKLAALNASLTLSDMIFQEIRDSQKEQEQWGQERFHELKKKAAYIDSNEVPKYLNDHQPSPKRPLTTETKKRLDELILGALEAHNLKDYRRAIEIYSEALSLKPDLKIRSIIYNHRGMARFMLQLERQALADFEMSFHSDSTNYRAVNNRALVLRRMGHIDEAFDDFQISLEIKDDQPEVYFLRGQTYFELKHYEEAFADVQTALDLYPEYKDAQELMNLITQKLKLLKL